MHIRDTKEFLDKVDHLKGVFGEKSRTKTMMRAVSLVHDLSGGGDSLKKYGGVEHAIRPIIESRMRADSVEAQVLLKFMTILFEELSLSKQQSHPKKVVISAMMKSGMIDITEEMTELAFAQ